jgi:hypothetical protein
VRVTISDERRAREVEKNLQEWLWSPLSLQFFKHIRKLSFGDLCWDSLGPGPAPNTEWMVRAENPERILLVASFEYEPFPSDAVHEIRDERLAAGDQELEFPPCRVEIVLGAKGRLYVVLPTGVETVLPYRR